MSDLELMLPSRNFTVNLETYIDAFPRRYFDENSQEYVIYEDDVPRTEYLNYKSMGLSFLFKGICLKGVFMYIRGGGYSKFRKSCTYLGDIFWENPSRSVFEGQLEGEGFSAGNKSNQIFLDMYKGEFLYTYMERPDSSYVSFGKRASK